MRNYIVLLFLFITGLNLQAQDIIYSKKEGMLQAKVTEVIRGYVRYKRFDNPNGPNYSIAIRSIDSIVYENGTKDVFGFKGKRISKKILEEIEMYRELPNNALSGGMNLSKQIEELIFFDDEDMTPSTGIFLNYERFFLKHKLGISISGFSSWNRTFYGWGIGAKYYPKHTGKTRIGFGPLVNFSVQNRDFYYYSSSSENWSPGFTYYTKANITTLAFSFSINRNINRKVYLNGEAIFGGEVSEKVRKNNLPENLNSYSNEYGNPSMGLRLGIGYRF